ncbi:MAG: MerR family transcriptional regulator [Parasporobacterium sp.]|nr:MerR family transcriptional regulator [Parasporobacterium sp.]
MKETYSINDVAMITGLSTRTIRNYISLGFLSGEKVNGAWSFTDKQIEGFTQDKAVKPSIKAKKNAIVFDFLGTKPSKQDKMCTILDLTCQESLSASVFFCKKISEMKPVSELHFASEPSGTGVRLILSGSPSDVMGLIDQYYAQGN